MTARSVSTHLRTRCRGQTKTDPERLAGSLHATNTRCASIATRASKRTPEATPTGLGALCADPPEPFGYSGINDRSPGARTASLSRVPGRRTNDMMKA